MEIENRSESLQYADLRCFDLPKRGGFATPRPSKGDGVLDASRRPVGGVLHPNGVFTPYVAPGAYPGEVMEGGRAVMQLNDEDVIRWEHHGRRGPVVLTDQNTQTRWMVKRAPCRLGCRCTAEAVEIEKGRTITLEPCVPPNGKRVARHAPQVDHCAKCGLEIEYVEARPEYGIRAEWLHLKGRWRVPADHDGTPIGEE